MTPGNATSLRNSRPEPGARVPLFDRLFDENPGAPSEDIPLRVYDKASFVLCVRRAIDDLLNTRCSKGVWKEDSGRTTLTYGLGDLTGLGSEGAPVKTRAAQEIEAAIAAFEPRLANVETVVVQTLSRTGRVQINLSANLIIGTQEVPVLWQLSHVDGRMHVKESHGDV